MDIFIILALIGLVISLLVFFLILIFFIPTILGAPYVPCYSCNIEKMFQLSKPKKGEVLYDLGSGDGKVVIQAAKNYNIKAVGIEINPLLVLLSRWRIRRLGLQDKAEIWWGNIFRADIKEADIVFCYLLQPTNNFLEKGLLKKLKAGTRIVSLSFTFKKIPLIKNDKGVRLYKITSND